jgi:predicted nuclease with TOPRIM domain
MPENNRLREENARLRQAIHNLINEKANLFHANTRIEERLNSLGKELEEARAENERLMQENAELRRQLDSLGARVAELERVFDERELSRKIEHAILAHLKGAGVSAKVSYLDHVTTALATPGSRRHREVSDAIARLKRTDPWVEDLIDFKTVIQDTKVSANDFAHKNRPKDFRSAFANVLATVTKLDASEYPTKDAFAQWLRDNERSIETLVLP